MDLKKLAAVKEMLETLEYAELVVIGREVANLKAIKGATKK